jgi:hypothetical protein
MTVNLLAARAAQSGLDATAYSAHGLRAGYLTVAANRGIPLSGTMQQSRHKSLPQAASYCNSERSPAERPRSIV